MANSKELTAQVAELYKKQTEEMKALEEQRGSSQGRKVR